MNDLLCDLPEKTWKYLKYVYLGLIVLSVPAAVAMFIYDLPQLMIALLIIGVIGLLIYLSAIILDT